MKKISLLIASVLLIPFSVQAREMNAFERSCRESLEIGMREVQPGPLKGKLRDCVRNLAAEARRPEPTVRAQDRQQERRTQAEEKALEKKRAHEPEVEAEGENDLRRLYNLACRQELNIGATDVVKPGPRLGMLLRCVERKVSAASRADNRYGRRTSVEERMNAISRRLLDQQSAELSEELLQRQELRDRRISTQQEPSTTRYLNIRQNSRSRTDFSRDYHEGSTASKEHDAQQCRLKPPEEFAQCIREALQ